MLQHIHVVDALRSDDLHLSFINVESVRHNKSGVLIAIILTIWQWTYKISSVLQKIAY